MLSATHWASDPRGDLFADRRQFTPDARESVCPGYRRRQKKGRPLAGAEAVYSMYRAAKGKDDPGLAGQYDVSHLRRKNLPANFDTLLRLGCDHEKEILKASDGKYYEPNNAVEEAYDLFLPQFMYPFFETSLRYLSGRTPGNTSVIWAAVSTFPGLPRKSPCLEPEGLGRRGTCNRHGAESLCRLSLYHPHDGQHQCGSVGGRDHDQ